jgi:CheY-like chemotaxis protein
LAISLPSEPLTLEVDATRISQVLSNLLNNAAKYMDPGGQIYLTARRESDEIVISVKDTGIGIPAEMLPRVFDMFLQVTPPAGRARSGLGIGMALARNLVELHGGSLVGHSRGLGHGSEFVLRLPMAKAPSDTAPVLPRATRTHTLTGQQVIVADDNRDAANSLGRLLRVLGADVQIVYDGAAVLAALQQSPAASVLLDLGMPGMDGFQIARRIREQPELSAVVLIALTGWGQEEDRRRTVEAGFDHHLTKPADLAALQALLISRRIPEDRAKVR